MATCSEMKVGEVYVCEHCNLEIQVVGSCSDSDEGSCACAESLLLWRAAYLTLASAHPLGGLDRRVKQLMA